MKTFVLNGWAASPAAWSLCTFPRDRVYTYVEQLDGLPDRALEAADEVVLVGWSMGGAGALKLALKYPEKIRGLVLVAATARMMEEKSGDWPGMSPRRLKAFELGVKITHGEGFFGAPEGKPNPYMADADDNLRRGLDFLRDTDLRIALLTRFAADMPAVASGRAGFPVFIFQSEKDGIVRPNNAAFLKRVFPEAVVEMIPGAEHALPIMIPEKIDGAVARCLIPFRMPQPICTTSPTSLLTG
ncbi:MAG: alpha/beta fold hydrolase [Kiritimatiellia bacterium]